MQLFILYETASGYYLFEKADYDEVGGQLTQVQKAIGNLERFSKMLKLVAHQAFQTAEEALENISALTDGKVTKTLKNFLTTNLPATKSAKKQKFMLGISDTKMG